VVYYNGANFQCLTGLQRLSINILHHNPLYYREHIKHLALILDKIPSLVLKKISFVIPILPPTPSRVRWHLMANVLQQSRFSQLTEIVFQFIGYDESSYGYAKAWILEDLAPLDERGILSVRYN